jgi:hypothetical protein
MQRAARSIHLVLAVLLAAGLVVQIFLAGLGVFAGASNFATHRDVGYLLQALPFFMAVAAWIGKLGRREVILAATIFVLFFVQSFLVLARETVPAVAALHPVNGFLVTWLAVAIVRDGWTRRSSARSREAAPEPSAA